MKLKLFMMLLAAMSLPVIVKQGIQRAGLENAEPAAAVAPAGTPNGEPEAAQRGAWMWRQHGGNPLDGGAYTGDYVPGKSVSLTPFSRNGGSVSKAEINMAGVTNFTPVSASGSPALLPPTALDCGAYGSSH
jgi:hypothetical protein